MTEIFTIEVTPVDKKVPSQVRLKRWLKNAMYYGFKVTRCAARYSNEALSPLPAISERNNKTKDK